MDIGFTGRKHDVETALTHFRARVYDPDVGRFVQSDPIGFAAGDLNLYAYTWNDPSNWSDPSGLAVTTDWVVKSARVVRLASRAVTGAALRAVVGAAQAAAKDSIEGAALCLGSTAASVIGSYARNYAAGNRSIDEDAIQRVAECAAVVIPRPCGCGGGGKKGPRTQSSFAAGTLVMTPSGSVVIGDLREGELVIARHEETGEIGSYPVTGLLARQAPEVIWLTLENAAGEASRLGITDEHPLFIVQKGWTKADQIATGDRVRNASLTELSVIAVARDDTPSVVHNLEIEGAHTYFVGEFEVWSHNGRKFRGKKRKEVMCKNGGKCVRCGKPAEHADHIVPYKKGGPTEVGNGQPLCAQCNLRKSCSDPIPGVDLDPS